jgi:hypothetical protein
MTHVRPGDPLRGSNWILFAGVLLMMGGVLNAFWGIAAIGGSAFFDADATYILSDLDTWGWIVTAVAALQILAALSVWRGGAFGRWAGIAVAGLSAISALMSISAYPLWSLAIFGIDVAVIHALARWGGDPEIAAS